MDFTERGKGIMYQPLVYKKVLVKLIFTLQVKKNVNKRKRW